jgi:predicted PhzF superfamily epimerase YddE/YHI9
MASPAPRDRPKIESVPTLHVLRVFVNEDGEWGNPLGVFLDGGEVPERQRQRVAAELGFSETVFVEDREAGLIRIHTPARELPFAGHPIVGAAWLLAREGAAPGALRPPVGEVRARHDGHLTHIAARPEWAPPFEYAQLGSPAAVRALTGSPVGGDAYAWAWIDEAAGTIRARCFAAGVGVAEDEATGSAALALCGRLGRAIVVHQGRGSVLLCRPGEGGLVEVGGKVRLEAVRAHRLE